MGTRGAIYRGTDSGAIVGQAVIVTVHPYYLKTTNSNHILGTFSTIDNVDDGTATSRRGATINGFLNEFFGSFALFLRSAWFDSFFGAEVIPAIDKLLSSQGGANGAANESCGHGYCN